MPDELVDQLGRPYAPMMDPRSRLGIKPANAGKRYPAEVYTAAEVARLIAACPRRGPSGLRNRALIVVMWRAGLRVAEAVELEPRDLDLDSGKVTVRCGKGSRGRGPKRRVVALEPEAMAVVERWLDRRAQLGVPRGSKVFCTIRRDPGGIGRPLTTSYVREMLHERGAKAEIDKRVHPHGLRHTCAVDLLEAGLDVKTIQLVLGHTDLRVTDRYLDHLSGHHVVAKMRARVAPPELLAA